MRWQDWVTTTPGVRPREDLRRSHHPQIPSFGWRGNCLVWSPAVTLNSNRTTRSRTACLEVLCTNARSVVGDQLQSGDAVFQRFSASKKATLAYYGSVVETMREHRQAGRLPGSLFTALERTVERLEELAGAPKRTTLADLGR